MQGMSCLQVACARNRYDSGRYDLLKYLVGAGGTELLAVSGKDVSMCMYRA